MNTLFVCFGGLFVYMTMLFVVSLVRRDNGTADIGYGIGFIVIGTLALSFSSVTAQTIMILALMSIWGVRLSYRIYKKNLDKPEDFRYLAWRNSWGKWFVLRSFFQIYILQGFIVFFVAFPVLLSIVFPKEPVWLVISIGFCIWCIGFLFEAIGDYQLDRFLQQPENKGKIFTSGLWRYTRHPNYFGESTMWWGMSCMCFGLSSAPLLGLISPILITYLLLFVSGIPMLEKRWKGNPEWEQYRASTSVFIPYPPKSQQQAN